MGRSSEDQVGVGDHTILDHEYAQKPPCLESTQSKGLNIITVSDS